MTTPRIQTWNLCAAKAFLYIREVPTGNICLDEMRQNLHISTTTAQSIVNYRQQNGPFTSIDQLQLIVSKTIYNKIKGLITI